MSGRPVRPAAAARPRWATTSAGAGRAGARRGQHLHRLARAQADGEVDAAGLVGVGRGLAAERRGDHEDSSGRTRRFPSAPGSRSWGPAARPRRPPAPAPGAVGIQLVQLIHAGQRGDAHPARQLGHAPGARAHRRCQRGGHQEQQEDLVGKRANPGAGPALDDAAAERRSQTVFLRGHPASPLSVWDRIAGGEAMSGHRSARTCLRRIAYQASPAMPVKPLTLVL